MADTPYEVIINTHPALKETLDSNFDVCEFLMAAYRHIQEIASESSNNPNDLIITVDIVMERLLKINLDYYKKSGSPVITAGDKTPVKRNLNITNLCKSNPSIREFPLRVIEKLERWVAETKLKQEQGYKNIKLMNAILYADKKTITTEIVLKFEFDSYVNGVMQWGADATPEQPTVDEAPQIVLTDLDAPQVK